jgi:LytS/YehU family sensor histidine kinase
MKIKTEKERANELFLLAKEEKLKLLRYQLNPHFLFNSLNSVQALVYENPNLADEMLADLSEFLQYSLKRNDQIFSSLGEEIDIISTYLNIEKIRFEERLDYTIEVDPEMRYKRILSFLIQPFVENSIKHGFKNNPPILKIIVKAYMQLDWIVIEINNVGKLNPNIKCSDGMGISNTIKRLDSAYENRYSFNISEIDDWVKVEIRIRLNNGEI